MLKIAAGALAMLLVAGAVQAQPAPPPAAPPGTYGPPPAGSPGSPTYGPPQGPPTYAPSPYGPPQGPSTYAPSPYGPPSGPPPPYGYRPGPPLTLEDRELIEDGEISPVQHAAGVVGSLFVGFGVGQAVQGRWGDTGWIFTLGEAGSFVALVAGAVACIDDSSSGCRNDGAATALVIGVIGFIGFHVWEIGDAIVGPSSYNDRVRNARVRAGYPANDYSLAPFLAPARGSTSGGVAGLALRF